MPTNLKSLLSRPRSRNELKFREKEDNEGSVGERGNAAEEGNDRSHSADSSRGHPPPHHSINCTNYDDGGAAPASAARPTSKNFFSCSALPALGLVTERDFYPSPDSCSTTNDKCFGDSNPNPSEKNNGSMRKCNTVLALSRLSHSPSFTTASSTPSSPMGPGGEFPPIEDPAGSGSLSASRVRMMRDRLYSASSSTLNNLINSSSGRTTKLLSGWKLPRNSPGNGSSSGMSPVGGAPCTKEHESSDSHCTGGSSNNGTPGIISPFNGFFSAFKSRSQVSVVEGSSSTSTFGISTSPAMPVTPVNRLRRNFSAVNSSHLLNYNSSNNLQVCSPCSRSSSFNSFRSWREEKSVEVFCRLCLSNFTMEETSQVQACSCRYCKDCLIAYVSFEIQEGAYEISCPDANCEKQGVLTLAEIEVLVPKSLVDKHAKFRLYREIEKDGQLTWCPSPGCETVCRIQEGAEKDLSGVRRSTITCTTCSKTFCADCKLNSHPDISCESHRRKLVKQGKLVVDESEIYSIKSIKKCPFCHVPIEKDSGCAQMMCKRCKHVFCWYCLTSLDDDFLLRHYDKGPCKNKLGHSRASVVWHRAQVIGIFAGFGILVLLASPLLILAAPCLLCCRCGYCANKLDPKDPVQL